MSITAAIACINAVRTTPALRASASRYAQKHKSNAMACALIPKRVPSTAGLATMHAARAWNAAKLKEERAHASAMQVTSTAMAIPPTAANRHRNAHAKKAKNKPVGAVPPKTVARVYVKTASRSVMPQVSSGAPVKVVHIPPPLHATLTDCILEVTGTAMALPITKRNVDQNVI